MVIVISLGFLRFNSKAMTMENKIKYIEIYLHCCGKVLPLQYTSKSLAFIIFTETKTTQKLYLLIGCHTVFKMYTYCVD